MAIFFMDFFMGALATEAIFFMDFFIAILLVVLA